MLALLNSCS